MEITGYEHQKSLIHFSD